MIKRIILVTLLFMLLLGVSYAVHSSFLNENLFFSLLSIYIFHAVSAVFVYVTVEIVSNYLPNQAGYSYLMMMCLKIGAFVLIFQTSVFAKSPLSQVERVSLVIPLFLFLIVEAIVVSRLLNSK